MGKLKFEFNNNFQKGLFFPWGSFGLLNPSPQILNYPTTW